MKSGHSDIYSRSLFGILIISFMSRIAIFPMPVWGDEYFTFRITNLPFRTMISTVLQDAHPPLYFFLAYFINSLGNQIVDIRALSFFFEIITIVTIVLLSNHIVTKTFNTENRPLPTPIALGDKRTLIILALLVSSPFIILFMIMARYYALFAALTALSIYLKWSTRGNPRSVITTIIVDTLMLYTNYIAGLIIIGSNIFLFLKRREYLSKIKLALIWILPWIFFIPIAKYFFSSFTRINTQEFFKADFGKGLLGFIVRIIYTLHDFISGEFVFPWQLSAIVMFILSMYLVYRFIRHFKSDIKLLIGLGILIPAILTILASVSLFSLGMEFLPPRIAFAQPFLLMAMALGLMTIPSRKIKMILLLILIAGNLHADYKMAKRENFLHSTYIIPYDKIAFDISKEIQKDPDAMIIHDDDAVQYYFDVIYSKNMTEISQVPIFNIMNPPANDKVSRLEYDKIWVVYSPKDITPNQTMTRFLLILPERGFVEVERRNYLEEPESSRKMKEKLLRREVSRFKKTVALYERTN